MLAQSQQGPSAGGQIGKRFASFAWKIERRPLRQSPDPSLQAVVLRLCFARESMRAVDRASDGAAVAVPAVLGRSLHVLGDKVFALSRGSPSIAVLDLSLPGSRDRNASCCVDMPEPLRSAFGACSHIVVHFFRSFVPSVHGSVYGACFVAVDAAADTTDGLRFSECTVFCGVFTSSLTRLELYAAVPVRLDRPRLLPNVDLQAPFLAAVQQGVVALFLPWDPCRAPGCEVDPVDCLVVSARGCRRCSSLQQVAGLSYAEEAATGTEAASKSPNRCASFLAMDQALLGVTLAEITVAVVRIGGTGAVSPCLSLVALVGDTTAPAVDMASGNGRAHVTSTDALFRVAHDHPLDARGIDCAWQAQLSVISISKTQLAGCVLLRRSELDSKSSGADILGSPVARSKVQFFCYHYLFGFSLWQIDGDGGGEITTAMETVHSLDPSSRAGQAACFLLRRPSAVDLYLVQSDRSGQSCRISREESFASAAADRSGTVNVPPVHLFWNEHLLALHTVSDAVQVTETSEVSAAAGLRRMHGSETASAAAASASLSLAIFNRLSDGLLALSKHREQENAVASLLRQVESPFRSGERGGDSRLSLRSPFAADLVNVFSAVAGKDTAPVDQCPQRTAGCSRSVTLFLLGCMGPALSAARRSADRFYVRLLFQMVVVPPLSAVAGAEKAEPTARYSSPLFMVIDAATQLAVPCSVAVSRGRFLVAIEAECPRMAERVCVCCFLEDGSIGRAEVQVQQQLASTAHAIHGSNEAEHRRQWRDEALLEFPAVMVDVVATSPDAWEAAMEATSRYMRISRDCCAQLVAEDEEEGGGGILLLRPVVSVRTSKQQDTHGHALVHVAVHCPFEPQRLRAARRLCELIGAVAGLQGQIQGTFLPSPSFSSLQSEPMPVE